MPGTESCKEVYTENGLKACSTLVHHHGGALLCQRRTLAVVREEGHREQLAKALTPAGVEV